MNLAVISDPGTAVTVGLLFGGGALIIGLITYLAVTAQIELARVQINLARKELEIVEKDLKQSTAVIEKSNRESKLWLYGEILRWLPRVPGRDAHLIKLSIVNKGNIVDLKRSVTIGFHKNIHLVEQHGDDWSAANIRTYEAYRDFHFVTFESTARIYSQDSIDIPPIYFEAPEIRMRDISSFLVLCQISSDYEQNPEHYGMFRCLVKEASDVGTEAIVNVFARYDGVPYGPFGTLEILE